MSASCLQPSFYVYGKNYQHFTSTEIDVLSSVSLCKNPSGGHNIGRLLFPKHWFRSWLAVLPSGNTNSKGLKSSQILQKRSAALEKAWKAALSAVCTSQEQRQQKPCVVAGTNPGNDFPCLSLVRPKVELSHTSVRGLSLSLGRNTAS